MPVYPSPIHFDEAALFTRSFWQSAAHASLDTLWDVVKIVVLYTVLRIFLRRLVDRIVIPIIKHSGRFADAEHTARIKTLTGLLNSVMGYVLVFVFGVMLLRAFRLDPIPLLTTASVAGLAVGFGAQKLVKDVISGFFILLENQYAVGDYVTIGAVTGTVQEVGMRTTRIRDDAGRLFILSNGDITQVCNQSRGPMAAYIEVGIAATADRAKAESAINDVGVQAAKDRTDLGFAEPPAVHGIGSADAAKIVLRVSCRTTVPARLAEAQLHLRGLILDRLSEEGIAVA